MTVKNGSQDSAQDKKIYVGVEASNTQERRQQIISVGCRKAERGIRRK